MARTSVHGSAYENMRFVYLSSLFDDADSLLAAARRACNGVDACEKRVAFMESGSKHGRLMAEGQYTLLCGRGAKRLTCSVFLFSIECLGDGDCVATAAE